MKQISLNSRISGVPNSSISNASHNRPCSDYINQEIQRLEHLHTSIGRALIQTPVFQGTDLVLYCGVPVQYLLPENVPPLDEFLDFVVCRGQEALLSVKLTKPDPHLSMPLMDKLQEADIPSDFLCVFQANSFHDDPVWFAQSVLAPTIGQRLQVILSGVKNPFIPIPAKLLKCLNEPSIMALELLHIDARKAWLPTEYGRSLGILQAFRLDKNNHVHSLLCCAQENLDDLRQTAAWREQGFSPQVTGQTSLSQRIDLINKGMTTQPAAMMDLVRQLSEMPLKDYLRDNPDGLSCFQRTFPDAYDFKQAAACIDRQNSNDLLMVLAKPLIKRRDIPLAKKSLRSVMLYASIMTNSRYLTWYAEKLSHIFDSSGIARNWTYQDWLDWILHKKQTSQSQEDIDYFRSVISGLIIKPFALISQQTNSTRA